MVARFLLALVIAEVLTELAKEALIFDSLRAPLRRWKKGEQFLECGYCMSVWGGFASAFIFKLQIGFADWWPWIPWWVDCLVCGLVIHRAANVLHEGISRWLGRVPFQVLLVRREINPELEGNQEEEPVSGTDQEEADGPSGG